MCSLSNQDNHPPKLFLVYSNCKLIYYIFKILQGVALVLSIAGCRAVVFYCRVLGCCFLLQGMGLLFSHINKTVKAGRQSALFHIAITCKLT